MENTYEYKKELAEKINFKGEVARQMAADDRFHWAVEGGMYDNRNKIESWSADGGEYDLPDDFGKIIYVFHCADVEGHQINYDEDNLEMLGAEDCNKENEVLVKPQKMRIVSVNDGMEDMGFIDVELELIK